MSLNLESVDTEGATAPISTTGTTIPTEASDLECYNLRQEATWLYEDNIKIAENQRYLQNCIDELEKRNTDLQTELLRVKEEDQILKRKLNECEEREVTHRAAVDALIRAEEEVKILQRKSTEDARLREQTERHDAEIQELRARMEEQQRIVMQQQQNMNDLHDRMLHTQNIADLESAGRKDAERKAKKLEDKLRILSSAQTGDVDMPDAGLETPRPRRRFSRRRLEECKRCHACLPSDDVCTYHEKAPIQVLITDSNGHVLRPGNLKFWPCCEKTGVKETEGCKSLPFHDAVVDRMHD